MPYFERCAQSYRVTIISARGATDKQMMSQHSLLCNPLADNNDEFHQCSSNIFFFLPSMECNI